MNTTKGQLAPKIRLATEADMTKIEPWLKGDLDRYGEGFYCNWYLIVEAQQRDEVKVLTLGGYPIGFIWCDRELEILVIHPRHRGKGYGTLLVQDALAGYHAKRNIIKIYYAPSEALQFWERFGFKPCVASLPYCYLEFPRHHRLGEGPRVKYEIDFGRGYLGESGERATVRYEGWGERTSDGMVHLDRRVVLFDPTDRDWTYSNHYMRLTLDGVVEYHSKVKYEDAKALGVQKTDNYFLDHIVEF